MIEAVSYVLLGFALFSLGSLLLGLWEPWRVLWFYDEAHRWRVVKWYGSAAMVFFVLYYLVGAFV
ncbi:hypothetical protein [Persicobacter psychrovividus]